MTLPLTWNGDRLMLGDLALYDLICDEEGAWAVGIIPQRECALYGDCGPFPTEAEAKAAAAQSVRDWFAGTGCVIVAEEPTPEMLRPFAAELVKSHGYDPEEPCPPHGEYPRWYEACGGMADAYRAMLKAAQENDDG